MENEISNQIIGCALKAHRKLRTEILQQTDLDTACLEIIDQLNSMAAWPSMAAASCAIRGARFQGNRCPSAGVLGVIIPPPPLTQCR